MKGIKMNINDLINNTADYLLKKHPERYEQGVADYGYYHNGVGMACCGKETIYNEEAAREDAKELLLKELDIITGRRGDAMTGLLEDIVEVEEVYNSIKQLITKG